MMYDRVVVPTVLYVVETWGLRETEEEVGCFLDGVMSMCGLTLWSRV